MRPDPNTFLWIAVSVADSAAVNPNGIKILLASGLSTFFIKGNQGFTDGPKSLPKNPLNCPIYAINFLKILYYLKSYLQKFYKALILVY